MRRPERHALWLMGFIAFGLTGSARARDRRPADAGADAGRDAIGGNASADPGQPPPLPASDDEALPEGHPAVGETDGNPHSHAAKGNGMPGVFDPPEDVEKADPALPPG